MPNYNYGHYLPEAIQSVLSQTRVPDEIIVIDDCSTDNTAEIVQNYPQVKYIRHEVNRGLAAARNTGIKASTCDYYFSFDADDILKPQAVEEHMKLAAPDTVVTCGLMAFGTQNYTARPEVATLDILLKRNCIYSNSLFPKDLWKTVGGYDESATMRLGLEDWLFNLECAKAGARFVTNDYIALLWRQHGKNMSTSSANPNWSTLMEYFRMKHPDFKA